MASVVGRNMGSSQRNYGSVVLTLQNCLLDVEKLAPTPSEQDGVDQSLEMELRILGAELIQTAGKLLKLPQTAMATGQVLMHRFYYSKSYVKHPMEITAMACLCLASKIEEAPRRTRDVINVVHHIKQIRSKKTISPMVLDSNYIHLKNQVIKAERRILKELGFCVHVQHPHKMIVMYLRFLRRESSTELLQYAWNAMNDALRTNVFVRFSPETVAAACIYLSARVKRVPLPNRPHWFTVFGMEEADLREIATAVLKLYKRSKPNPEALERAVDELRTRQLEQRLKNKLLSGTNTPQGAGAGFSPLPSQPNSPAEQVRSGGRHTPNGDAAKTNKENVAAPPAVKRTDSSRSRSSNEDAEPRKPKQKNHREERSRARSRSRSPTEKRRRHSSTPDRHRSKSHKKDKDRSREKHRRRSAERDRPERVRSRSRSPVRSKPKPKHERVLPPSSGGKRDRRAGSHERTHKNSEKKRAYETSHKRR